MPCGYLVSQRVSILVGGFKGGVSGLGTIGWGIGFLQHVISNVSSEGMSLHLYAYTQHDRLTYETQKLRA